MLTRVTRWFLIAAPVVAGVALLVFGTAGTTSVVFGISLIGITPIVWMWNWFLRMSFDDDARERETEAREQRAREGRLRREAAQRTPTPPAPAATPPRRAPRKPRKPRRRPL